MNSLISTLIITQISNNSDDYRAQVYSSFFKTGKGEYGEGDLFLGVTVPVLRQIAKQYYKIMDLEDIQLLLENDYHEVRCCGVICLVYKYEKADIIDEKETLVEFYLKNIKHLNNWDLIDISAPKILGKHILENYPARNLIIELAKSDNIWSQRIAIMSTFPLIKSGIFEDFLLLANQFLKAEHDLIQKATGWMLREMGKADIAELIKFLDQHASIIPRTMLRYSIEKLPEKDRQYYLSLKSRKEG